MFERSAHDWGTVGWIQEPLPAAIEKVTAQQLLAEDLHEEGQDEDADDASSSSSAMPLL